MAINLTGLLQGFQQGNQFVEQQRAAKRAEEQFKLAGEQFKLTERKQRGMELDTKFKEARRVAELDAADEDATLKSLMQPGMDEGSRQAILASRNRRRTENEAYLKSMTADPEMSQELSTRFGDVTKLMKPSSIQSGMLPKPSMDISQLIKMAEGYRKEAELTPDAESKGFLVQRGRDALSAIGASQQIIDKFLPGYKSVVGKGAETASPLTAVMEPEALRAKGLGAGSTFVDPQTGQTVRLTEQDGKLMKSYVTPAKDITAEYMPSGIEGAKVKKIYADIDRTEAAIKDIDSKIKMRPEEMKLKTQQVFAKISNDQLRAKIAKESLGIRYAGLALRRDLAELAREDAKRKLGINTSFRMADFNRKIQATAAANVGRAEASLLNAKKTLAQATTEGKPNERQAAQEAINFLEGEVATLRRAASGGIDYSGFKQSMDSIGLGDVDIDMSMFGSTSPMQSYGYQGYPQQQQAPVIVVPGGGAPAPYPYPYPPSPYPVPAPVPAPGGGTTAGSAVFRLSDGSAIPIGPDGFRVGQQPGQVSNKANALVKMMSGGKK